MYVGPPALPAADSSTAATPRRRSPILRALGAAALVAAVGAPLLPAAPVEAAMPVPRASVNLPSRVEGLAKYDPARLCSPTSKPGAVALMRLLTTTYKASRSLGISRACGAGGKSEHKEGRAIDWGVRAWVPAEKANAEGFIRWALAPDARGNRYANARRLGIMYMIWNDRIWTASHPGWQSYKHPACRGRALSRCNQTLRHRDHVHVSLSWSGARKATSFWTGKVGSSKGAPSAGSGSSTGSVAKVGKTLKAYRGKQLRKGSRGTAVVALQKALRMKDVTGNFGALTNAAVKKFQRHKGLPSQGIVGRRTWAALQAELSREARKITKVRGKVVRPGAKGSAVRVLEAALNRKVDGKYGKKDVAALKRFQRLHGVPTTGTVARLTWAALRGV